MASSGPARRPPRGGQGRGQRGPERGVIHRGPVGLPGDRVGRGLQFARPRRPAALRPGPRPGPGSPASRRGRGPRRGPAARAVPAAGPRPPRRSARPAAPGPGQRQPESQQQQPYRHRVLGVAPARRDAQSHRTGARQQGRRGRDTPSCSASASAANRPRPTGHVVRPGQQPSARMGVCGPGTRSESPAASATSHHRDHDHGRARAARSGRWGGCTGRPGQRGPVAGRRSCVPHRSCGRTSPASRPGPAPTRSWTPSPRDAARPWPAPGTSFGPARPAPAAPDEPYLPAPYR